MPSTDLRRHIKAIRKAKGWTQGDLGERLGIGGPSVSNMESLSSHTMGEVTLRKLATAFGEPIVVSYEPNPRVEPTPITKKPTPRIEPAPTPKNSP